ncbi:metal-dependent hydrolase [Algiphilus sp. NNCM1]|jgi:predicted metal-dependent hydrolase|uniref:metal-dependent hydrolase n=1 Tax=Algiphilus sp. TaxID=1872431 RepID=UPI001CA653E6|nr:metal-dependent hydrolase [Algiphilus sp.]MBY8964483.1 metal-dependent hydrolase [Algiphilus acroporae]MCI5062333.1 metal-dependent hydrolase [Algiphilus sp.]MCI5103166.1 metal-dependent hydrolase [Algiphilus sp.]
MAIASRKLGFDEVEHRDLNFGMSPETVPRHWFGNDPWTTHWMNAILAAVPDGERWVMQATRKQLDNIHDPSVRKAAIGFIRQEHTHAREHDAMNEAMVAHGIPVDRVEAVFKVVRQTLQRYLGDVSQCAIAATFEHFTAVISQVMLDHPELWDDTKPEVSAMLFWHFVEETEHKSVSFDVFMDASGGGFRAYAIRMATLALGVAIFVPLVHGNWLYFLWKDRQLSNVASALRAAKTLFLSPGIFTRAFVIETLPFLSPRFHPWDTDNREVIHAWKRAYEETGDAHQAYQAFRQWHAGDRNAAPVGHAAAA